MPLTGKACGASAEIQRNYGIRRVYETTPHNGKVALRLRDQIVELGAREFDAYEKVRDWLPSTAPIQDLTSGLGIDEARLQRFVASLEKAGLLFKRSDVPAQLSGEQFHSDVFNKALTAWLSEAFAHPFWERMMSGRGSARLFAGWLIELYHYTRNANRHMPLSCAHTRDNAIKLLRAKQYAEEWDHYHYFLKSLAALGFSEESVTESIPLPMTLALSNFMRQAAREDILCYSICSAVLEGTAVERKRSSERRYPYYEKSVELYNLPREAIDPIYAHLDLDAQYQHSDLFLDILKNVSSLSAERASRVLDYGHQLVEHIWMWTENIERYYEVETNPVPRRPFDLLLD
jgi:pyrroloquinoline quinone (PQQ) biosynthesis protein C